MTNDITPNSQSIPESIPASREVRTIAGFWARILALLIDTIVLGIVGIVLGFMLFDQFSRLGVWGLLIGFSIAFLYFGLLNSRIGKGQTIGKRIMRIKVVSPQGEYISIARSFLRYSALGLPFFLNGAMIPPSILITPIVLLMTLLVFGFGGAIIYLYICNGRTRQTLHDLIARTCVVKSKSTAELNLPAVWKGHLYVTGAWLLLSVIFPVVTTSLATRGVPFADLLQLQKTLMDSGNLHMASVFIGQEAGIQGNIDYLRIDAVWKSVPYSIERAEKELASIVLREYPDAIKKDLIVVTVAYGYDIGISSAWRSATDQASPVEWMARAQPLRSR